MKNKKGVPAALAALVITFASGGLTGCTAEPEDTRVAYCVDEAGTILNEDACDNDSPNYRPGTFIWIGNYPTGLRPGSTFDWSNSSYGGQQASASDTAARSRIGVSGTGRVSTGTKGGIGIGKSGSGGGRGGIGGFGGSGGS